MKKIQASKESVMRQVRDARAQIEASTSVAFGLIVDGKALDYLLLDDAKMLFFNLAVRCSSVICCRSTPRQKSLVSFFAVALYIVLIVDREKKEEE